MRCVEFERRLNELLDDPAAPDSDLELVEHADECGDCAELLAGHELLLRGMATLCDPALCGVGAGCGSDNDGDADDDNWQSPWRQSETPGEFSMGRRLEVPADLAVRVAAEVVVSRDKSRLIWWWLAPAIAASVLIAVAVWNGARAKQGGGAVSDPNFGGLATTEPASLLPNGPTTLSGAHWRDKLSQLGESHYQWMDEVADGLKPVADSMSAALHALRRTWPGAEAGARSSWSPAGRTDAEFIA